MSRACEICAGPLTHPRALVCGPACKREKKRRYDQAYRQQRPKQPVPVVKTKYCPSCEQRLPAAAFGPNQATASGLQCHCRECRAAYAQRPDQQRKGQRRKARWYRRHHLRVRVAFQARYHGDAQFRHEHLAACRLQYHANRDRYQQQHRVYYRRQQELAKTGIARGCACGRTFYVESRQSPKWFCGPRCRRATMAGVLAP